MKMKKTINTGERDNVCTSVFKNGKSVTTKEEYTKKWIELINAIEKNKNQALF